MRITTKAYKELIHKAHHGSIKVLEDYINTHAPILHKCLICEYEWKGIPSNVKKGHGCKKCSNKRGANKKRLAIKDCHLLAEKRGFSCLSNKYINARTPLEWKCDLGHTWKTPYQVIKRGSGCPMCYHTQRGGSQRLSQEYVESRSKKVGLTLLDNYTNSDDKLRWECSKGHVWRSSWSYIKTHGNCCFRCYIDRNKENIDNRVGICLVGKNELEYFNPYVTDLFKNYEIYCQFEVSREKGWPYFVDFVIPELNLAIEYDERGHSYRNEKDTKRQRYIENKTGLNFIRVSDREFMKTKYSEPLENLLEHFDAGEEGVEVDEFPETSRGDSGFGSSGR